MTADTWTKSSEQALQREQVSNIHKHRDEGMRGDEREGGEEGSGERGDKMRMKGKAIRHQQSKDSDDNKN